LEIEKIIQSTVNDVLDQIPSHGYFQELYWEGNDGVRKGIVLISGEKACHLMREAIYFISEDPIEGPSEEEVLIDRHGAIAKIFKKIKESRYLAPESEDTAIIMACLEDVVNSCDDQVQLSESCETMVVSLSNKRSKSAANVLSSLLRLIVNSGIPLREVVQYMEHRDINDKALSKLRIALDVNQ
jgi:hypothetical protein